jgi:Sulfotransferase domain
MGLRVIGAGFARTGTHSLKIALERLLGTPCYHMWELLAHQDHAPVWTEAAKGKLPDWDELLHGYGATVDFPAAAFWRELMEAYPDSLILLSYRDTESWWKSCSRTAFPFVLSLPASPVKEMIETLWEKRFITDVMNEDAAKAAFESYNNEVRMSAPRERLVEWQPQDGWSPICSALGLPVPGGPFPHVNTSDEFIRERFAGSSSP